MTMHKPPHPGEFIQKIYLEPNQLSAANSRPGSALPLRP
jgi:plasmid maintenance system antidote protein VapI